jgi:uncharacterized protein
MSRMPVLFTILAVFQAAPAWAEDPAPTNRNRNAAPKAGAGPAGFIEMTVAGVMDTEGGQAVVLQDEKKKTFLPIWIGGTEALSIQLRLERRRYERPLTHDLLDSIVHELGGEIVKVHIDDLKGSTFVATLFVKKAEKTVEIDARPSDSIALALGNRIPIFVSKKVIDRAGSSADRSKESEGEGRSKKPPPGTDVKTL